jgi:hypothetical protein
MKKAKYPYGISNFEQLIKEKFILIDKTPFIELLEENETYVSYLRPRRIGKSLFVSILQYYYDLKHRDKFQDIFGNTYIGQNPTPLANSFRVLKFDFSGIDTRSQASTESGFLSNLRSALDGFMEKYHLFEEEKIQQILRKDTPADLMRALFEAYRNLENAPAIYLLIDEYDHFTNEILWRDLVEFRTSVSQDGYVRKFYENIKIATQEGIVARFFITGVSPITLDSLTSGFNIVTHLTHAEEFHDMMGFTEEEVGELLDMCLEATSRRQAILQDLKMWYNGYKFNVEVENTIYNANMTLFFLQEFKKKQQYPRLMLDPNIMPDYGKLKKMFEVANFEENVEVLQEILANGVVESEQIYQFDFSKPFGKTAFVNFLYYLGNLTIQGDNLYGNGIIYTIPNQVIKELYWQYYAFVLQQRAEFEYEEDGVKTAIFAASGGNITPFLRLVEKSLKVLSNRDFQRFDEKYVKMLVIAYSTQGNAFHVISERETTTGGYIDLEMYIRPNNRKTHAQYVFEIKYIKKEQESAFETIKESAKNQLLAYLQNDQILQSKQDLHAYVVIFVKDELWWERVN